MPNIRERLIQYSLLLEKNQANEVNVLEQGLDINDDLAVFQWISNLILNTTINEFTNQVNKFRELYYLLLIFFETLVIRDIFQGHFVKDTEFIIERAPLKNNNKIHPDSHLASFLFDNNI